MISRRSVLLSSSSGLLGRVDLVHHDEVSEISGLRTRWHVRERWVLGGVRRSQLPCDCISSEADLFLPSPRALRGTL
jgi:hypothetical protein